MSKWLSIHPDNPQPRLISQAVNCLQKGGLIAYPTRHSYALGCLLDSREALERLYRLHNVSDDHPLTLICRDIAEIARYANLSNQVFKTIKLRLGEHFTFVLPITKRMSRQLNWPRKRSEQGFQLPTAGVVHSLLDQLHSPLVTATLYSSTHQPLNDGYLIDQEYGNKIDLLIDTGVMPSEMSTVIDLGDDNPQVLRQGCATW